MKHPRLWVLLGVLLPASALAASTGPLSVEDLSSPLITASGQSSKHTSNNTASTSGNAPDQSAGLYLMMERMQRYQDQIDKLRGQVEELKHTVDQMRNGARDRYMDLDTRLRALADTSSKATDKASTAASETVDSSSRTQQQSPADSEADRKAYMAARGKLLSGDHKGAVTALSKYLKQHANGAYVPQAHYWLGEVYRIEGDTASLTKAANEFSAVVNDYPQSTKVQEALYKLAVVKVQQGDTVAAKKRLHQLLKQFPDGAAAKLAAKLLKQL